MSNFEGTSEAIIIVKASPQVGKKHGETVCCAGVNDKGEWVRLYPVTFRTLNQASQFRRWDRIRFRWQKPKDDPRPESLRVDHQSIEIKTHHLLSVDTAVPFSSITRFLLHYNIVIRLQSSTGNLWRKGCVLT